MDHGGKSNLPKLSINSYLLFNFLSTILWRCRIICKFAIVLGAVQNALLRYLRSTLSLGQLLISEKAYYVKIHTLTRTYTIFVARWRS
jgi:hypothetical protein